MSKDTALLVIDMQAGMVQHSYGGAEEIYF